MDEKQSAATPRKSFWALIKESLRQANSGCGPECGCHAGQPGAERQRKETPATPPRDKGQA